ncbi:MAG: hypothetical protein H7237_12280 [Alkalinema sp. FL-bin-369]|nr:hypothetical protein [Leptolyngbyaceae cyanobacterium LF-bin-369]
MQPGSLPQSSNRSVSVNLDNRSTLSDFFGTLIALLTLSFPLLLISQTSVTTTAPALPNPIATVTLPVQD